MNMPLLKSGQRGDARAARRAGHARHACCGSRCRRRALRSKLAPTLNAVAARVLPPLIMLALILIVWQILCSRPGATLPSPTKIWSEARDLIVDPFFVAGPQDIGLGWRVLVSLQRVMIGYGLAA